MFGAGEMLAVELSADGDTAAIGMAGGEGSNLLAIFFGEYRAGGVEHFATRREDSPQGFENVGLLRGKAGDVVGTAQPLDVRVAAHHTGGGAGHVGQDTVEETTVPPAVQIAAIRGVNLGV